MSVTMILLGRESIFPGKDTLFLSGSAAHWAGCSREFSGCDSCHSEMEEVIGVQEGGQPHPGRGPKTPCPVRATEVPNQFCSFAGMDTVPEDEAGEIRVYQMPPETDEVTVRLIT